MSFERFMMPSSQNKKKYVYKAPPLQKSSFCRVNQVLQACPQFPFGWGTGGFKATPGSGWVFAHTVANDQPHDLNAAFAINRFVSGALIDEHGAAGVAH